MTDQPEQSQHQDGPTHGPNGDFVPQVATAERDRRAAELRGKGWGYREIAAELGIDVHTAHDAVKRALNAIRAEGAVEVRQLELERLDATLARLDGLQVKVEAVLERHHVTVQQGRIVYLDDEPLLDDAPVLAAVDRLVKIEAERRAVAERRAKLLGLDAEQKVAVSGGVTYEIVGLPEGAS